VWDQKGDREEREKRSRTNHLSLRRETPVKRLRGAIQSLLRPSQKESRQSREEKAVGQKGGGKPRKISLPGRGSGEKEVETKLNLVEI